MIRAVLCDIEGTTTPLSFVHDVLFPLSREKMDSFVRENWSSPEFLPVVEQLKKEIADENPSAADIVHLLHSWIDADKKEGALKQIQGKIWREAFESGQVCSPVYPDVPAKWAEWKKHGLQIFIYSSGSIEAQQLLFRYSEAGDLTRFIDGYFDTSTGPKKEVDSYKKIASVINLDPAEILFLSDVSAELDAARKAGLQTVLLVRDWPHSIATTFHQIRFTVSD